MADNGSSQSASTWPLVRFQFSIKVGDVEFEAQEVTGLSAETQIIEYRTGKSKTYTSTKMPGIAKYGNITIKKGMFKDDKAMWDMYDKIKMNTYERMTVVVSLLDEAGSPVMTWNLINAFPVKMTVPDMKADANEAAIEQLEIAHEGLTLQK